MNDHEQDELIIRWWPMVRGISRGYPLPGMDAEDVEQEGLIALLEAARRFDPGRGVPFKVFASDVVHRRLCGVAVKANRLKHGPLNDSVREGRRQGRKVPALNLVADRAPRPEEVVIQRERLAELARMIREDLTEAERVAIRGVLNEHPYTEIAVELRAGGALRYVDNAVQRARRKLRAA